MLLRVMTLILLFHTSLFAAASGADNRISEKSSIRPLEIRPLSPEEVIEAPPSIKGEGYRIPAGVKDEEVYDALEKEDVPATPEDHFIDTSRFTEPAGSCPSFYYVSSGRVLYSENCHTDTSSIIPMTLEGRLPEKVSQIPSPSGDGMDTSYFGVRDVIVDFSGRVVQTLRARRSSGNLERRTSIEEPVYSPDRREIAFLVYERNEDLGTLMPKILYDYRPEDTNNEVIEVNVQGSLIDLGVDPYFYQSNWTQDRVAINGLTWALGRVGDRYDSWVIFSARFMRDGSGADQTFAYSTREGISIPLCRGCSQPSVSSDQREMVYVKNNRIFSCDLDYQSAASLACVRERALTPTGDLSFQKPCFDNSAQKVLFLQKRGESPFDVGIINANGSGLMNLTETPEDNESSPACLHQAMNTTRAVSPPATIQYMYQNMPTWTHNLRFNDAVSSTIIDDYCMPLMEGRPFYGSAVQVRNSVGRVSLARYNGECEYVGDQAAVCRNFSMMSEPRQGEYGGNRCRHDAENGISQCNNYKAHVSNSFRVANISAINIECCHYGEGRRLDNEEFGAVNSNVSLPQIREFCRQPNTDPRTPVTFSFRVLTPSPGSDLVNWTETLYGEKTSCRATGISPSGAEIIVRNEDSDRINFERPRSLCDGPDSASQDDDDTDLYSP